MQRAVVPELMDDPAIPRETHEQALAGLTRLNRWSRSDAGLWAVLRSEAKQATNSLRVLDVATGSGDLPVRLACRARRAKLNISLSACDISPTALEMAKRNAMKKGVAIEFFQQDAVQQQFPEGYDVIITSLFLHHLAELDAIQLLQKMAATSRLILVNDLNRSRFNLGLVAVASRVLSRSRVVHHDGPASVRAAFTVAEARHLAVRAGLTDAKVVPQFPCRWLLTWRKPA